MTFYMQTKLFAFKLCPSKSDLNLAIPTTDRRMNELGEIIILFFTLQTHINLFIATR